MRSLISVRITLIDQGLRRQLEEGVAFMEERASYAINLELGEENIHE